MERYEDHKRTRSIGINFRVTPEEYRQMEERIKITGMAKNEFMIHSMLKQHIEIRAGKFESDRLSLEVRRLKEALEVVKVPEETVGLLLECRALLEQIMDIVKAKKEEPLSGKISALR